MAKDFVTGKKTTFGNKRYRQQECALFEGLASKLYG